MKLKAYKEGIDSGLRDRYKGIQRDNPYPEGTEEHQEWEKGYTDGFGKGEINPEQSKNKQE